MIRQHRKIPKGNHIGLYRSWRLGLLKYEKEIKYFIHEKTGECTGHVPYSASVCNHLKRNHIRTVFIWRDLRDVVASRFMSIKVDAPEVKIHTMNGGDIRDREDMISDLIHEVATLWERFSPWLDKADAVYRYEELRGAALLLGNENALGWFQTGAVGEWKHLFEPRHEQLAERLLHYD